MRETETKSIVRLPRGIAVPDVGELARRSYDEPSHPYRTAFVRDGARVLHTHAFRRLAGKTQVFARLSDEATSDHFRSRLTHTLEVAQISRSLAESLGLNAKLAEALALVHDIGHPPFGHAGEKALDGCLRGFGLGFDHNLHALRIVSWSEDRYAAFRGLNLTLAVREGIIKHSHDYSLEQHPELAEYLLAQRPPLEAQLIDWADEIAYLTADLDDGLESGILTLEQVREGVPEFCRLYDALRREHPAARSRLAVNEAIKQLLNQLATDLRESTLRRVLASGRETLDEIRSAPERLVALSPPAEAVRAATKRFLFENLYHSPTLLQSHVHAKEVVQGLFAVLMEKPNLLPEDHQTHISSEGLARTVADYIAGMTDNYIEQFWTKVRESRK